MFINSWLDSLRSISSLPSWSLGRVTRRSSRLARTAEFLEDRTLLSSASPIDTAIFDFHGEDGIGKDGPMAHLGMELTLLHHEYQQHLDSGTGDFEPSHPFMQLVGDRVLIDAVADQQVELLQTELDQLGVEITGTSGGLVSGLLPLGSIGDLATVASLRFARFSPTPVTRAGIVTSQGDVAQRSDLARSTFGLDGSGVTVGVISDSYDCLDGASNDVTNGDLPSDVVVQFELQNCGSGIDEGRAMMQIVHDVAPGADLAFHTGFGLGTAGMATSIYNLAMAGKADVIVDDLGFADAPMFQTGHIANAVEYVSNNLGVSYFSAAGNDGRNSYESEFRDSGLDGFQGSLHDFDPGAGVDAFQEITVPPFGQAIFSFQWDEPFASVSGTGSSSDLDVFFLDSASTTANIVNFFGGEVRNLNQDPYEFPIYFNSSATQQTVHLAIVKWNDLGPDPGLMKSIAFNGSYTLEEYDTQSSTLFGHVNAASAIATGAARYDATPAFGQNPPLLESFSSAGGTPILFDTAGNRLSAPEIRLKPVITAPDGANTSFFSGNDFEPDGFPNFFGTSAAAPHAAGVAALLLEPRPFTAPGNINNALQTTAVDMGSTGFDHDSGSGLISSDAAVPVLQAGPNRLMIDAWDSTTSNVGWDGADDTYILSRDAGELVVSINGAESGRVPISSIGEILIVGSNDNDRIRIDHSNGVIDDTINISVYGFDGTDEIEVTGDTDFTLTDSVLLGTGIASLWIPLTDIEQVVINGGGSGNTMDVSGFTLGPVTLAGGAGNDTLTGSDQDDHLSGGSGTDLVLQTSDAQQVLTDTSLTGRGDDVLSSVELANLAGGISGNHLDATTFSGAVTLSGGPGNDTLIGAVGDDSIDGGAGEDEVQQTTNADQVLTDNSLTGQGSDTLTDIERAILTGGISGNSIDAIGFTSGRVTLQGGAGNDTLHGSPGNDLIDGGDGTDEIQQTVDANQVLSTGSLSGLGFDTLISIESAILTGGGGDNAINAAGFGTGSVTLVGGDGNDTLTGTSTSDTLDGGPGTDTGWVVFDGDLVLTDSTLVGPGSDTLIAIERFTITGGSGDNHIDASAYTLGSVTLDGAGGNDTLLGSASDDTLIGGTGTDTIEQTVNGDQVLSDTTLQGLGTDSLSEFEQAVLSGGASDNLIDAESFTGLGVTLSGTDGNDTLLGSAGNDSLDGGAGTDLVSQSADTDHVVTNTSLTGHGTDVLAGIEEIRLTGGTGDNSLDAAGFTAGPATLSGGDGDDTLRGSTSSDSLDGGDGTDVVVQVTGSNQVLTNTTLTGMGLDVLSQIEQASLTGDSQANQIDASAFTAGPVTVSGLLGDDTITGSSSDDTLDGGDGLDVLTQASDSDQVLNNTTLTGHGNDTHSSFEHVQLTGGAGDNRLDAGSFTIGVVTLDGDDGNDTLIGGQGNDTLAGGDGTDQVEQSVDGDQALTDTQLTGRGVDTLSSIESGVLSGGSTANLITAETFTNGPVTLDGGSGDDTLVGSPASDSLAGGSGTDRVRQTADNDQVATDTQLTGHGTDVLTSIENVELIGGASANRLNTSAFSRGSTTLVGAGGDDTLLGSAADDSLDGGTGNDQVEQFSDTDQVLTSSTLTGRGNDLLTGIELAVLTGGPGDNTIDATGFDSGDTTLAGSDGDDTLLGSSGDDQIEGGPGTDLVVSTGDFDHVLSATSVIGAGNDTLVDVETAHLFGGDSANTLDASGFAGDTTLGGGDGDDTLLGGSGVDLVLQTADADQLLTTTTLTGLGQNTLSNVDQAKLIGGDGSNRLDASAFTPGPVTLDGAGGDDTLLGSAGDDQITGGAGTDLVVSTGTANQVLSDTLLQADSDDVLSGIELAELHGSGSDNLIDATAFSGDTTLHGSPGDDTLAGGTGNDLLRQTVDADQSLTDSQLTGNGNDVISGIEFAWLTGGGSDNTIDAQDFSSGPVTLDGAAGNDTLVGGSGDDRLIGSDGIDQVQQQSDVDQVLTDSLLTGSGNDEIDGIEEAQLSGGSGDNLLDATAFNNGPVTLSGLDGNDTLRGSAGNDSLSGGDGLDRVEQTIDADQTLSNTQLVGRGTDGLDAVETAHLIGGSGDNVISASSFTLGQVTLDGAAGDDNLTGGSQADSIIAGDGDDVANGRGGNDMMSGGDGNDDFTGGGGDDTLLGEAGDDSLNGQGGRDSILGADGDDWLFGNGSPDTVTGGRGDDQVLGGASGDVLNGSSGNDTVDGGDGSDRVFGGSGTDMLVGGDGADRLNGQGGSGDVVLGNDGDDTVQGGSGNDLLDGGPGYDELRESGNVDFLLEDTSLDGQGTDEISSLESARLTGGRDANVIDASGFSGPVTLRGSGGDDLLRSSSFDDLLLGGNGDDTLESGSGLDTLEGGTGTDRVKVSGDGDFVITDATFTGPATTSSMAEIEAVDILAGPGDNILDASNFSGNTTLWGGGGRDVITGGIGNDWLNGNDGEDELNGGGGIDLIHGGAGSDLLFGGDGDDTINGEAGDDTIDGGGGNDHLVGEDGHDRLLGRDGDDSLYGGTGNDELLGHAGRDRLNGESGNDTLLGDLDPDTLWGGNGNDVISGDDDNDRLYGQSGNDTLLGAAGDDRMQGGSDRDVLAGGDGDDTLNGQKGYDTLMGGDGRDRFNSFDSTAVVNELFALPDELFTAIDRVRNG